MRVDHADGLTAFLAALDSFDRVCESLTDERALNPSRCHGWVVADVLAHVHLGLQELLLGMQHTTGAEPTTDAADYWRATPPTTDPDAEGIDGLVFARRISAAYRRPTGLIGHLRPTLEGLARAADRLGDTAVEFQGHVLTSGDLLATWAVELAVHHLDITDEPPAEPALRLAAATVRALVGEPLTGSDTEIVLGGADRIPFGGRPAVLG
ncbi:uncharacterized protein (TIGR03083 family) [Actinokineospora spheciospongiae]|nr:uncharacterized protein (TIGR03083 family) [Actinokineospora spheciospongiae]